MWTSVYAHQVGTAIHYRVVDEYGGETLSGAAERESIAPLTLGELEEFFTTAWPLLEVLESNFDADLESMLAFFKADSTFYPDLDALLRQRVIAARPASLTVQPLGLALDDGPRADEDQDRLPEEEIDMTKRTKELQARYEAAHAKIMAGDYANLQADIDSGAVWSMGEGAVALALKMLIVGAVMAPSVPTNHPEGPAIPVVWELDGENGRGSIQGAEAYLANEAVLD